MSRWRVLLPLLLLGSPAAPAQLPAQLPTQVEVITAPDHPIGGVEAARQAGIPVQVYDLAAPAHLEAALSRDLPPNLEAARSAAAARVQALDQAALARQAADAYAGALKALEYGLDRYPAVVFDGGAGVVYGVADLREALTHYRRWLPTRR